MPVAWGRRSGQGGDDGSPRLRAPGFALSARKMRAGRGAGCVRSRAGCCLRVFAA